MDQGMSHAMSASLTSEKLAQRALDVGVLTEQQLQQVWGEFGTRNVELAPFTVIIGRNDTGKSSLLDGIESVLSGTIPQGGRRGWWVPSEEGEHFLRSRLDIPDGPLRIHGPENGRSFVVESTGSPVEVDAALALQLIRPAGEVVRLDTSRSVRDSSDAASDFLAAIVEDSSTEGWSSAGDPDDPGDIRHLLDRDGEIAPWVSTALDLLAERSFDLIPEFLRTD